jgi:hypothetical protein
MYAYYGNQGDFPMRAAFIFPANSLKFSISGGLVYLESSPNSNQFTLQKSTSTFQTYSGLASFIIYSTSSSKFSVNVFTPSTTPTTAAATSITSLPLSLMSYQNSPEMPQYNS